MVEKWVPNQRIRQQEERERISEEQKSDHLIWALSMMFPLTLKPF